MGRSSGGQIMTKYTIPAPDGKTYTIDGPEGASKDEVIAEVLRQNPQAGKAPTIEKEPPKVVPASSMSFGETGGGAAMGRPINRGQLNIQAEPRPLESAMAGATRSVVDPLLAGAQIATNNAPRINELVQRLAKEGEQYKEANPASYGTGRVAGALLPAVGMSRAIGVIPSFGKNPYVSGAVIGAGTGAVSGALQPVEGGQTGPEFYNEVGANARTGALIGAPVGAVAPVVGQVVDKGYKAGKAIVEPFLESGQEKILGRFLRQMSGGEEAKAMRNLRNPQQFVEGSQPTAAQVAGVPSLAALERTAIATSPTAGNLMAQRQTQNAQAQANALRNIAPETRISKYADLRERVADDLYSDALKPLNLGTLDDKTTAEISSLIKRPAISNAMEAAKENAANRGIDIADPAGSMRGLHETKMALDRQIKTVKAKLERDNAGASSSELEGLMNAKTNLLNFMEKISPTYKSARISYDRLSKPIEQLESIQKLAGKTISSEAERIKGVTDFSNKLEELKKSGIASDRQIARLEAIKQDLARTKFANEAGKGVGSDTVQKLAYSNLMSQTGLPISATNKIGKFVYGDINEQLKNKLAESMMSPQETLRLMRLGREPKVSLEQKKRNDLARLLTIQGVQNTVQGAGNE
jgi:hypothetical protein